MVHAIQYRQYKSTSVLLRNIFKVILYGHVFLPKIPCQIKEGLSFIQALSKQCKLTLY